MFGNMWQFHAERHGHGHRHPGHGGPPWARGMRGYRHGGRAEWLSGAFGMHGGDEAGQGEDVRWAVLDAVAAQPRSGFEITQAIEQRAAGGFRATPAIVYPTLQLLEELGHVRVIEQDARKSYAITESGQLDLEAHRDAVREFYDRFDEDAHTRQLEEFADLMQRAARVFKEFRRASRRGRLSSELQRRVREVIVDAVQRVEGVLAEAQR
jgi:DNA-binding PadR family transcriptional regulator